MAKRSYSYCKERSGVKMGKAGKANNISKASKIDVESLVQPKKRAAFSDLTNVPCYQHCGGDKNAPKKSNNCLTIAEKPRHTACTKKAASKKHGKSKIPVALDLILDDDAKLSSSSKNAKIFKDEKENLMSISEEVVLPEGVSPFDQDENPDLVHEYAHSIFSNMRTRETKYPVSNYLFCKGAKVTDTMRAVLVDWLIEVQGSFELYHETLYLTVRLLDHYLQNNKIPKEQLQLVGISCLFLACKVEEHQLPSIDDLKYICDDAYTAEMITKMEIQIFRSLNFDINMPISYRFLRRFCRVTWMSMEILTLARYILELSLLSAYFVQQLPSKMAAASLCLAMRMKIAGEWTADHVYHSGYKKAELLNLMRDLNQIVTDAQYSNLKAVKTKYSHPLHYSVSKTKPLPTTTFT